MVAMVEKYVNTNQSHSLETFFDHEVFKATYNEIKRQFIDFNITTQPGGAK